MTEEGKRIVEYVRAHGFSYELMEHEPVYTVDEIEKLGLWNHENGIGAKNLFLRDGSGKRHFLVVIREDQQADLKQIRKEIGSSRLSFASKERLAKYLKVSAGSVSPLGILNDAECEVEVFFDIGLKEYLYTAVHPNDNSATLWMKTKDLVKIIQEHGNSFDWVEIGGAES